jgi:hypothetical protein
LHSETVSLPTGNCSSSHTTACNISESAVTSAAITSTGQPGDQHTPVTELHNGHDSDAIPHIANCASSSFGSPQSVSTFKSDIGLCLGAALASSVVRHASSLAFRKYGRSMTTPDVLGMVGLAMATVDDSDTDARLVETKAYPK